MRKILLWVLFVLGGAVLALTLRTNTAHALAPSGPAHVPGIDQIQKAENENGTQQDASSKAETKQANVNVPIAVLSFDSNNGNVDQQNRAETNAKADNQNSTDQGVEQSQQAKADGNKGQDGSVDQHQYGTNENETQQDARSKAETKQVNVNAPISILSAYSNNGDVQQGNRADTNAKAENGNSTNQGVEQNQQAKADGNRGQDGYVKHDSCNCDGKDGSSHDAIDQKQGASNYNDTDQHAKANAETKQANFNVPISVLSFDSNNGNVDQQNSADTNAKAGNWNGTDQWVGQNQYAKAYGGRDGGIDQHQYGTNENETEQHAKSYAETKQVNVNAPISVLSYGSNNGDVQQGNWADTNAYAKNGNDTQQYVDQSQGAKSSQGHDGYMGKDTYGNDGRDGQNGIDQKQKASNENETEQRSYAKAETKQANVNVPISVLSIDANNGNVDQQNGAKTNAKADNWNGTEQGVDQSQWAKGEDGHGKPAYGEQPGKDMKGYEQSRSGSIDQHQYGTNENETQQDAHAKAETKQLNWNTPVSFLSFYDNNGNVQQGNWADTNAKAKNGNETNQWIDQQQLAKEGGAFAGTH